MKKLKVITGGMPLRVNDLDLIQTAAKDGLAALIQGLIEPETQCIVAGLEITVGDTTVTITEGIIFVTDELFYVPTATFALKDNGNVYFTSDFTTSENRTFHDTTTHDIWDIRNYVLGYDDAVPGGSISILNMPRLSDIQISKVQDYITLHTNFTGYERVAYLTGFGAATGYGSMRVEKNAFGLILLLGAFNATVSSGKLGVLPVGSRPTGDFVGYFFNWSIAPGVIKIKRNGEIWVSGVDITDTNYVSLLFPLNFEDPVYWGLPTGGGGTAKKADSDKMETSAILMRSSYQLDGITENKTLPGVVMAGTTATLIYFKNASANAVTVSLGTTLGGSELVNAQEVAPGQIVTITYNNEFSSEADQDLFLHSANWNGATLTLKLNFEKGI